MRKRRTYKRKRGPVVSKKVEYDGITFASGLEKYMYCALKKAGIKASYDGETFVLLNGFHFIIETKGRPNESFPMRWKLFKKLVMQQFPSYTLFKPQNQKECDRVIEIIQNQPSI